jgi:UDP-glucose 4-epimerase
VKCFVTGGAGFVGSNLVDMLLARGEEVVAYDNLTSGFDRFLEEARDNARFRFVKGDLLDTELMMQAMAGVEMVYHLAANADVRFGTNHPDKDLQNNTIGTFNVLEAMRANGVRKIAFSSTGSVYGEAPVVPTPEDCPFPVQTSLYAASKLAGEALISSYCEGFGFEAWIFRFVSILGKRYTHGHVFDFVKKLLADPSTLHILGNGKQLKSYMDVSDLMSAMAIAVERGNDKVNIFNLGTGEATTVNQSVAVISERLGVSPDLTYSGGERGWIGDNPVIQLDSSRIRSLGWAPDHDIRQGVQRTVDWLLANQWALNARD